MVNRRVMLTRLSAVAISAAFFLPFGTGAALAAPLTQRDLDDLGRVTAYVNSIRSLQAKFAQVGPNGELDKGNFYVRKPGRFRFQYDAPSPYLIVSDGVTIAVSNSELKTVDRYPLVENPLNVILSDKVDLAKDVKIGQIERKPGQLAITIRQDEGTLKGQVTLIFSDPAFELRQWIITDAQGLQTLVVLEGMKTNVELEPEKFILKDVNKFSDPNE